MRYLAAVVQLTTTQDTERSFTEAEGLVELAAQRGAELVVLPENVSFMGPEADKVRLAEPIGGPSFLRLSALAKKHGIWLVGGTLPELGPSPERAFNTSTCFAPDGKLVGRYRKIHLFDVSINERETHEESRSVAAGDAPTLVDTPIGRIGMSVCYDLRFPDLYRNLVRHGAELLTVPAAFTVPTGRDHWEVLLRARAIENQCYVLAAGQVGQNTDKRQTYGRSMIVDPWGTVLAKAPDRTGIALAEIDIEHLMDIRKRLPCLSNERPSSYGVIPADGL